MTSCGCISYPVYSNNPCNDVFAGFGHLSDPQQWYLTGMDISKLPNPIAGAPVPQNITVTKQGPWTAAGITYFVPPPISPTQTYNVVAKTVGGVHMFDVVDTWNYGVKNCIITSGVGQKLYFDGFVHVDVNVGSCANDHTNSHITLNGSKRGNVVTGAGDDQIFINLVSNGPEWTNQFRLNVGDGNDAITIKGLNYAGEAGDHTFQGAGAGLNTTGNLTSVFADLGGGNDTFNGYGEKDYVRAGSGDDRVLGAGGKDRLHGGEGRDLLNGGDADDHVDTGLNSFDWSDYHIQGLFYGWAPSYAAALRDAAEKGEGGNGNDTLVSRGEGVAKDGSDWLWGNAGCDRFYFGAFWGHDVVGDFVAGAFNGDPAANAGDRLMVQGATTGSPMAFTFTRVNFNGGNDDLLIALAKPNFSNGCNSCDQSDLGNTILLRDFFTINAGKINTALYDGSIKTVAQLAAFGGDNIFEFNGAAHNAVNAAITNFYA